jgi:hypothetical protein
VVRTASRSATCWPRYFSGEDVLVNANTVNANGEDGVSLTIGGFNLVTSTTANNNKANGINLQNQSPETSGQNAIVRSVVKGNRHNGVITDCRTNVVAVTALNNGEANLSEPSPAGCVNVHNKGGPPELPKILRQASGSLRPPVACAASPGILAKRSPC